MTTSGNGTPKLPAIMAGGEVRAIVPQSFDEVWRIANAVCKAGLAPRGLETPEKAMVAIMHGLEVGLPPMAALQSVAVINNRPSIYGDGVVGLVRASGKLAWIKDTVTGTGDEMAATCEVKRRDDETIITGTFSVADAKISGLWTKRGKNGEPTPWQLYPRRMLQVRARTYALRDGFADVLRGLGVAEEQEDIERMRDVTPANLEPPPPPPGPSVAVPPPKTSLPANLIWEGEEQLSVASASGVSEEEHDPETGELPPDDDLEPPPPPPGADLKRMADAPVVTDVQVQAWFTELENAFSGCEDLVSLGEQQAKRMVPMRRRVSTQAWKQAERIVEAHLMRLRP